MKVKATKFKDVIKVVDSTSTVNRVHLSLVSGKITLTDKEWEQLGTPDENTILEIRIKNTGETQ